MQILIVLVVVVFFFFKEALISADFVTYLLLMKVEHSSNEKNTHKKIQ